MVGDDGGVDEGESEVGVDEEELMRYEWLLSTKPMKKLTDRGSWRTMDS